MRIITLLVALCISAAGPACDSVPLVAPTQSSVRLVVADTALPSGGSTAMTATVTEAAGTPVHDGTVVTFSTTLGAVHPAEAPTTRGRATATYTAGHQSGTADLVAYSGGAVSEPVQIAVGAAAVTTLRLSAQPASLPPTGGTTTLVATVLDGARNGLPDVRVAFSTTAGTLRDQSATTDATGEARTVLSTTTTAEVTAATGETVATAAIAIEPATAITITADPAQPAVGQAVVFEVTLTNEARALRSAVIDFGDRQKRQLGTAVSATVTHKYATAGPYNVTVTATDVAGYTAVASLGVEVAPAASIPVTITASPAAPVARQPVTFTVVVSPPARAPAVREATIDFGDESKNQSLGALTGRASVAHVYKTEGSYIVTATVLDVAGRRHTASLGLQVLGAPSIPVTITASPAAPVARQPVTFTVVVSPPARAPAVREATIDFGDESKNQSLGALTGRASVAHVYKAEGSYIVTATVVDATGRRHASSIGVVVAED